MTVIYYFLPASARNVGCIHLHFYDDDDDDDDAGRRLFSFPSKHAFRSLLRVSNEKGKPVWRPLFKIHQHAAWKYSNTTVLTDCLQILVWEYWFEIIGLKIMASKYWLQK